MSRKAAFLMAEGGPGGPNSSFADWGDNIHVPAQTQLSNNGTFEQVVFQVPNFNSYDHYGALPSYPASTPINTLWAVYFTMDAAYTQTAGGGVTLRLYRAGTLLGGSGHQDFMGYAVTTNSGGLPTVGAFTPTSIPWITGWTGSPAITAPANQVVSSTVGYLPLYPGDVVTVLYNNKSGGNWTPSSMNLQLSLT